MVGRFPIGNESHFPLMPIVNDKHIRTSHRLLSQSSMLVGQRFGRYWGDMRALFEAGAALLSACSSLLAYIMARHGCAVARIELI
jgi:hypothetical protein